MHGTGNDFIVLDGVRQYIAMTPERARSLGDRHFGVGADQILLVEPATEPEADFRYRIFNADGGEVSHCGNGARCFMRFVHDQNLSQRNPLRAQIATGILVLHQEDDNQITVDMGGARFDPAALGFDVQDLAYRAVGQDTLYTLPLAWQPGAPAHLLPTLLPTLPPTLPPTVEVSAVAISNPHVVQWVDDVTRAPVKAVGAMIESHPRFADRVNVGFMQFVRADTIHLRVFERGVGETLACGTGACAAVVAGIRQGRLQAPVSVHTRGGVLTVTWDGHRLNLRGPAISVYRGTVDIDQLVFSMALSR